MNIVGKCCFEECGKPVLESDTRMYPIRGFEETRAGGGQNHVWRKERIDGWVWHRHCWEMVIRRHDGGGPQGTLM